MAIDSSSHTLLANTGTALELDNYVVPGPDWLWRLDGHDKLARFGIEIYGCVDAYSRKIIWFYVGSSNRTQVSVLRQYLYTVKARPWYPQRSLSWQFHYAQTGLRFRS